MITKVDIHSRTCVSTIRKDGKVVGVCGAPCVTDVGNGWLCTYHDSLLFPSKMIEMDREEQNMEFLLGQISKEVREARV